MSSKTVTQYPEIEHFNSMTYQHVADNFISIESSCKVENFTLTVVNNDLTNEQFPLSKMTSDFEYCSECSNGIEYGIAFMNSKFQFMTFKTAIIGLGNKIKEGNPFGLEVSSPKDYPVVIQGNCYHEEGSILFEVLYFKDHDNDIGYRDLFKVDEKLFFTYYDVFVNEVAIENSLSPDEGVKNA